MIKLLVFDLGNVLLPFEHRQIAVRLRERSREKQRFSAAEMFDFMFDRERGYVNPYEEGVISSHEFFLGLKQRYMLDMDFEDFKETWNPIFTEDRDVSEIVLSLKAKAYPMFLLSNTNDLHFTYILEHFPIVHIFDEWILSFEIGAKKPSRRIYEAIFEKTDVEGHHVLYVDDVAEYVQAAAALGMNGIVFKNVAQLREVLKRNGI